MATPNMNLTLPSPSVTPGPDWASQIIAALEAIDAHTHSSGSGVQVSPAGFNVSSAVDFLNQILKGLSLARFTSKSAVLAADGTNKNQLYVVLGELYYQDSAGNNVKLTTAGSVNGSPGNITGMSGTTSAVTYSNVAKSFAFTQDTGIAAKIACGDLIISETVVSANTVTLKSPSSLASSYSLTLPAALPASTKLVSLTNAGVLGNAIDVDGASLEQSGTTLQVKDGGITRPKLVAVGQQVSSVCTAWSNNTASYTDVTNLTVTITTTGRPVMLMLRPSGDTNATSRGYVGLNSTGLGQFRFLRGATDLGTIEARNSGTSAALELPASTFIWLDTPAAGTYTYKFQGKSSNTITVEVGYVVLIAFEL